MSQIVLVAATEQFAEHVTLAMASHPHVVLMRYVDPVDPAHLDELVEKLAAQSPLVVALGPLLFLSARLWHCKIEGQHEYGSLATDYTRMFQARWFARRDRDDVLGSADIQSLADLGNASEIVSKMRLVPFGPRAVITVAAAAAAPMVPVALLGVPLPELLAKLAGTLIGKPG